MITLICIPPQASLGIFPEPVTKGLGLAAILSILRWTNWEAQNEDLSPAPSAAELQQ